MAADDFLTEREEELLSKLEIYDTIGLAASKMDPPIAASTARAMISDVRRKRVKATNTVNRLNNRGRKDARLNRLLSPIHRIAPVLEEQPVPA